MTTDTLLNHIFALPSVKRALDRHVKQTADDIVEGIVDRAVERARIDRLVEDAVEDAVDGQDIEREIERAIDNVIEGADIESIVSKAVDEIDIHHQVETSLRLALKNLVVTLQPIHEGKPGSFRLVVEEEEE